MKHTPLRAYRYPPDVALPRNQAPRCNGVRTGSGSRAPGGDAALCQWIHAAMAWWATVNLGERCCQTHASLKLFDDAILLGRIGRDELLGEPVVPARRPKSAGSGSSAHCRSESRESAPAG